MLNISIDSLSKVLENYTSAEKDSVAEYCTTVHTTKQNNKTILQKHPRVMDLHTTIDYGIGISFKNYVQNRHGKLKGRIGQVLEDAIREYLESHSNQHHSANCTIYQGKGIRNDVHGKLAEIKHELHLQKQFPYFSASTLKKIIRQVIGTRDYRTERKYILLVSKPSKEKINTLGTLIWDVTGFCNSINNS